ncbi:JAB1/Mov34/MPN/PAD-1 ubiquitin protease [Candidatus Norongarragalina meridionalis]|nr:JAB1/Mov34/MPN/PAD-1 ubiquitin protease [Candidatus Norongarragalina meridionalis]
MAQYDVYIDEAAVRKAEKQFRDAARNGKEAMGLLLGNVFHSDGSEFVHATDYVTAPNDSTAVSVRFTRQAFSELSGKIRGKGLIVAWAHSHPGYGCFLSSTDMATQHRYFSEKFHFALVMDPTRREGSAMLKRAFRLKDGGYEEVSFAVVRKRG